MAAAFDPPSYSALVDQDVSAIGEPHFDAASVGDRTAVDTGSGLLSVVKYVAADRHEARLRPTATGGLQLGTWKQSTNTETPAMTVEEASVGHSVPSTFSSTVSITTAGADAFSCTNGARIGYMNVTGRVAANPVPGDAGVLWRDVGGTLRSGDAGTFLAYVGAPSATVGSVLATVDATGGVGTTAVTIASDVVTASGMSLATHVGNPGAAGTMWRDSVGALRYDTGNVPSVVYPTGPVANRVLAVSADLTGNLTQSLLTVDGTGAIGGAASLGATGNITSSNGNLVATVGDVIAGGVVEGVGMQLVPTYPNPGDASTIWYDSLVGTMIGAAPIPTYTDPATRVPTSAVRFATDGSLNGSTVQITDTGDVSGVLGLTATGAVSGASLVATVGGISAAGVVSGESVSVTGAVAGASLAATVGGISAAGVVSGASVGVTGAVAGASLAAAVGGISAVGAVTGSSAVVTGAVSGASVASTGGLFGGHVIPGGTWYRIGTFIYSANDFMSITAYTKDVANDSVAIYRVHVGGSLTTGTIGYTHGIEAGALAVQPRFASFATARPEVQTDITTDLPATITPITQVWWQSYVAQSSDAISGVVISASTPGGAATTWTVNVYDGVGVSGGAGVRKASLRTRSISWGSVAVAPSPIIRFPLPIAAVAAQSYTFSIEPNTGTTANLTATGAEVSGYWTVGGGDLGITSGVILSTVYTTTATTAGHDVYVLARATAASTTSVHVVSPSTIPAWAADGTEVKPTSHSSDTAIFDTSDSGTYPINLAQTVGTMTTTGALSGASLASTVGGISAAGVVSGASVSVTGAVAGASLAATVGGISAAGDVSGASVGVTGAVAGASLAATVGGISAAGVVSGASVGVTGLVSGTGQQLSSTLAANPGNATTTWADTTSYLRFGAKAVPAFATKPVFVANRVVTTSNNTTGDLLQSPVAIDASGNMTGVVGVTATGAIAGTSLAATVGGISAAGVVSGASVSVTGNAGGGTVSATSLVTGTGHQITSTLASNPGNATTLWADTGSFLRYGAAKAVPAFATKPTFVANSLVQLTNDTTGNLVMSPVVVTAAGAVTGVSSLAVGTAVTLGSWIDSSWYRWTSGATEYARVMAGTKFGTDATAGLLFTWTVPALHQEVFIFDTIARKNSGWGYGSYHTAWAAFFEANDTPHVAQYGSSSYDGLSFGATPITCTTTAGGVVWFWIPNDATRWTYTVKIIDNPPP